VKRAHPDICPSVIAEYHRLHLIRLIAIAQKNLDKLIMLYLPADALPQNYQRRFAGRQK
jgi:hypothetical protein